MTQELDEDGGLDLVTAGRWFELRADYAKFGRLRMVWVTVRELFWVFVTAGFLGGGDFDPKRQAIVFIHRRDSGQQVAEFPYSRLGEADMHVNSLTLRLASSHVFDFCREVGIDPDLVAGAGTSEPSNLTVWRAVSRRELRRRIRRIEQVIPYAPSEATSTPSEATSTPSEATRERPSRDRRREYTPSHRASGRWSRRG